MTLAAEQVQTAAGCMSSMVEPVAVFAAVEHCCCFGLPAVFELKLPPESFAFVAAAVQESLSDR